MALEFDKGKLNKPFQPSISVRQLSIQARFYFGQPSVLSDGTGFEFSEHIDRIGGFDSEAIDERTFNIISNF